ncbi:SLAM family member 5-like isoform X2 [Hemicordylus capensis]|uniref:SLAM family member 5-like isoform X2 n=1 Tax=Hemicordylus capensis TaxID=884348 RepID=UPI0023031169|nr:SLAM family member 5-like isoform X2 [Hemicordylus capensis]
MTVMCTCQDIKIPLLLGILIGSFLGTGSDPAQNLTQLNKILGASVSFPAKLPSGKPVHKISWVLKTNAGKSLPLVQVWNGTLEWFNSTVRFRQRLEMADKTTLRIKNLEVEDSGVYEVRVTMVRPPVTQEALFNLTVYEPVPEPQILHQLVSDASDGCNVTLQCHVPGKGGFNVSWKRGNPLRDAEEGSNWCQFSNHSKNLHLFWQPDSSDASFTCLVSNLVDQKKVSLNLFTICSNQVPKKIYSPEPIYDNITELGVHQDAETFPRRLDPNSRVKSVALYSTLGSPSHLPDLAT